MTVVLPNKTSELLKSKRTKTSEGDEFNQQTNKSQKKVRESINEAFLVENGPTWGMFHKCYNVFDQFCCRNLNESNESRGNLVRYKLFCFVLYYFVYY